ncbi:cardiomyopathy-associated protein 5 [Acanthochromis polyacanthus]|uniref:cardiomyopathy-associated protein 5 n=1 Tax=Acanthochromis polyacanthus TaxID=80966 RepID=UPI0022344B7F|nr:cardiomyopathy-associated protein 5 [Acanthochromis polyacanthus]
MEECESLDTEMTELQEFQCETSDAISQDDEDEVEELQNSLREVVQDQSVKPKLQCLMVDPSFSMVTVQSEDSGIVWETASSRCSTPWASETSSTSEAYSMEGSGTAGKITIVFDEEKIVRRRTRSGGRSSRLGDRLSRPGSSRSASVLGMERPEMAEVSLPNVKEEKSKTEPDLEEIKSKDQQLFSLISEGYEILNIRVPSKLPTVDEEESTELQDNLSYLDQTPKIRSRNHNGWTQQQNHVLQVEEQTQESSKQDSSQPSAATEASPTEKESTSDIDYFEKFTLLDEVVPGEQAPEPQEEAEKAAAKPQAEEQKPAKVAATDSPSASEDSFVFVTDVEIVGEHLDEVFYGEGAPPQHKEEGEEGRTRTRRESKRSTMESGSVLFGTEETVLTPIYISPGPPKIIDPILLEEPTAMSFMYSDLYEDAMGERRRSDEEHSEAESVTSEKSYRRRMSDSEDADGYLEKFILKDETPTVDVQAETMEDKIEGRMMWPQSKFDMTGCLIRVAEEDDKEKTEAEEPKTQEAKEAKIQEVCVGDQCEGLHSEVFEEKREIITETDKDKEDIQLSTVADEAAEDPIQESKPMQEQMEAQQVKDEVKMEQKEPSKLSTEKTLSETHHVDSKVEETEEKISEQSGIETEQPFETQKLAEKMSEVLVVTIDKTGVTEPVSSEEPPVVTKPEIRPETTEQSSFKGAVTDTKLVTDDKQLIEEAKTEVEVKEPETVRQEMLSSAEPSSEMETSAKTSPREEPEAAEVAPEDVAPVEVITDCDCGVRTVVEVTEKAVNEKEIQTQVQIDLQEATIVETTDVPTAAPEEEKESESLSKEPTAVKKLTKFISERAEQQLEVKTKISGEVAEPVMPEEVKTDLDMKRDEILEAEQQQQETTDCEPETTITETKSKTPVQEIVNVGDELIVLVPKGQAVEMDIEISKWSEEITEDTAALPEPESTCELQAPLEETKIEPEMETKPEAVVIEKELPQNEVDTEYSPPAPVEEADTEEQTVEDLEEDKVIFSPLRSFTPLEDLSGLHGEDTEISKWSEEITEDTAALPEPESTCELQAPLEETKIEPEMETKPEAVVIEEEIPQNDLEREYSIPAPMEEADTEEQRMEQDLEEHKVVISSLRSFTPLEDLSGLHGEDIQSEEADVEQKPEMHKMEDEPETSIMDILPYAEKHSEDREQKMEQDETAAEAPEVPIDELEYEVISEQESKEIPEPETLRELIPESDEKQDDEKMEMEFEEDKKEDLFSEEELIEADYEIIDTDEENQARLAAELQGMDWFCVACGCLLSEEDCEAGEHRSHEVTAVDKAYEEIKEKLSGWISELQERSENIEDLVSELELAYNSVEDQCVESEAAMQAQNEEMMALVMEQYNNMSVSMEEEKKTKLEQLYDQIVSFQESIDSAKATLETTAREAETDARSPEDIHERLKAALDAALSLELGPKGLLVFEDYAKANTSSSNLAQRKGIPVPQRPTLQAQEPGSATSTSVTVYWNVNPGDIIDCFQVYCMEDPQGAVSEEYRVTVKESYCVLEELEPDKMYKVWVMAVNYTGCSLPSERLIFRTAPSVPVIDTERCTVMWDSATLRWSSAKQTAGQSYTLEYCRQYELEGEGLRSISGITVCEQKVLLQPNENYLFYIKAVNEAGASEQSEAALISTKGTRFHLLKASAHPALELSENRTTVHYTQEAHKTIKSSDKQCPSILGELLPAQGLYYWETIVSGSAAYRLGVSYSTANTNSPLGENSQSWSLQCIPTPSGCRYQLLHNHIQSSVFVIEMPERVGTLLDYQLGQLSFYDAQNGQLLGTFRQRFTQPCHPALALELPGSLEVGMVLEVPEFTKDS